MAGGIHPGLPLTLSPRRDAALGDAAADGVASHRYSAVLYHYWLVIATLTSQWQITWTDAALRPWALGARAAGRPLMPAARAFRKQGR